MHIFKNTKHAREEAEKLISCAGSFGHAGVLAQVVTAYILRHQPLGASGFEWSTEESAKQGFKQLVRKQPSIRYTSSSFCLRMRNRGCELGVTTLRPTGCPGELSRSSASASRRNRLKTSANPQTSTMRPWQFSPKLLRLGKRNIAHLRARVSLGSQRLNTRGGWLGMS
jgi:hypothetical protein